MEYYEQLRDADHRITLRIIEQNRIPIIVKKTGYSIDVDPEGRFAELKKLIPEAGGRIQRQPTLRRSLPTCSWSRARGGGYDVRLEEGRTPRLFVRPRFPQDVTGGGHSAETREYIKRKLNSAQWLIESIEQRRKHAGQSVPSDCRPPDRISRQGPRGNRAAEDAADCRQGGGSRDDGQPARSTTSGFRPLAGFSR